jgi:hypothetical protein
MVCQYFLWEFCFVAAGGYGKQDLFVWNVEQMDGIWFLAVRDCV